MTNETQWDKPAEFAAAAGTGDHRNGPPGANLFVGQCPDSWDDQARRSRLYGTATRESRIAHR